MKSKNKNKSPIIINNIASKNKEDIVNLGEEHINLNGKSLNNSDKNLNSKWNLSKEKKSKQLKLIYSHPNLNTYKITNNSYGYNLLNNNLNPHINGDQIFENNIMNGFNTKGINHNMNKGIL